MYTIAFLCFDILFSLMEKSAFPQFMLYITIKFLLLLSYVLSYGI